MPPARTAKKKTSPAATSVGATATVDDIARRAYELFLTRGCAHGHDLEDWLRAERELRENGSAR